MKFLKFLLLAVISVGLLYFLNNRWVIGGNPVPPLGKFLDPQHGFWQNADADSIPFNANIEIAGLTDSVSVWYDEYGIPHIQAQNNEDLFKVQGYVVAQHRLWQMEFQTHAAAGRLSELVGSAAVSFDRLQRRKGMVYGAKKSLATIESDPALKSYMEHYTEGVNAYINSLDYKDLPLEYKLLNYRPEEWSLLKAGLLIQYMVDDLTGYDKDIVNTNAFLNFGEETFNQLYPQWPQNIEPVVTSPDMWDFEATPRSRPDSLQIYDRMLKKVLPMPDPDNGSNNWAVADWKTKNGHAILSSDMHLGLNAPSLWFLMQLQSPEMNVMGFALTGNIGIVSGFNENIAWAFTNVARDGKDWYAIQYTDESQETYTYGNEELEVEKTIEEIKIRDGESFFDTVRYTVHGPVVYDADFTSENGKNYMAMKWIGHEPSRVQLALLGLNQGKSYDDYLKATRYWDTPPQHVAFASDEGEVAIRVQGLLPNRFPGQGHFILDGSDPDLAWQGFVPVEHTPFEYQPERGFVSSANQHSVDSNYPYHMPWLNMEHYRNRRINDVLSSYDSATITPKDMMALQNDSYGIRPEESLPFMLDSIGDTPHGGVLQELRSWDYIYKVDTKAPSFHNEWWYTFKRMLWDEMYESEFPLPVPSDFNTMNLLKNGEISLFVDNAKTPDLETLPELLSASLDTAVVHIQQWEENNDQEALWGNYKHTAIIHLARIPAFSTYNIQVDGEADAVNSTKGNHGPSQRIVVEMSTPPKAWVILPGGQSGNPGNPLYDNMIPLWRDGEYLEMKFLTDQEADNMIFKQKFTGE